MNSSAFFAQPCVLCAQRVPPQHNTLWHGAPLCPGCHDDLTWLPAAHCPQCALPSPNSTLCGQCLRHPPAFDATYAALAYAFPLDTLVQRYKYAGELGLAALLASLMLVPDSSVDLILPMPLHPRRLAERGFNQAAELARRLAARAGKPWDAGRCQRVRDTPPQAGLDLKTRQRNLLGAFTCAPVAGLRIAVLDDVMTTGASLNALARTLKAAGAAHVENWVLARTL